MSLVKTKSGIVGGHNYDFAGPSLPAGLTVRAHSFTFATYAGKSRLRAFSGSPTTAWLEDTNAFFNLTDGPVLWQGEVILDGIFAFPGAHLGIWDSGAPKGLLGQHAAQTTCDVLKDNAGPVLASGTAVSFGTLAAFTVQIYYANGTFKWWYSPNSGGGASTVTYNNTHYDDLVRQWLWRVGFGGLGGSGSGYLCESMLMGGVSGTRVMTITVSGLPSGWVAKIKNGGTTVTTITGPATTTTALDRPNAGFGHSVPFGGWTIEIERPGGIFFESATGAYIGDVWAFTVTQPTVPDFWTVGPNNNQSNPGFRTPRILIMRPTTGTNYARGKPVTMAFGTPATNYSAQNITDGEGGTVCKIAELLGEFVIDLGVARRPHALAIVNHNLDVGNIVGVQGANVSDFTTVLFEDWGFAARYPVAWIDLRDILTVDVRYIKVLAPTNSRPVALGEVLIGTVDELDGGINERGLREVMAGFIASDATDEGLRTRWTAGCILRGLRMDMTLFQALREIVEAAFEDAGRTGERVLVIPNSLHNEAYYIDWPASITLNYPQSLLIATGSLELVEESFGAL